MIGPGLDAFKVDYGDLWRKGLSQVVSHDDYMRLRSVEFKFLV